MKKITICYPYCNQPELLNHHIDIWENYNDEIKEKLDFIIMDQGYSIKPLKIKRNLKVDLKVYGIIDAYRSKKVQWIYGCHNLAYMMCNTDWLLYSNLDHIIDGNTIDKILKLPMRDPNVYYMFKRYPYKNKDYHRGTWMIHKEAFWKSLGIEEAMNGEYGFEDSIMMLSLNKKNIRKVFPKDIVMKYIDDKEFDNSTSKEIIWSRNISNRNMNILSIIEKNFNKRTRRYLLFNWKRTY